jgi:hypothetical protein
MIGTKAGKDTPDIWTVTSDGTQQEHCGELNGRLRDRQPVHCTYDPPIVTWASGERHQELIQRLKQRALVILAGPTAERWWEIVEGHTASVRTIDPPLLELWVKLEKPLRVRTRG